MKAFITNLSMALLMAAALVSCKKTAVAVSPATPGSVAVETVLVNNASPYVFFPGLYQAVYIDWVNHDLEGNTAFDVPDPKFIPGNYTLLVEASPGADSLRLTVSGSGTGPVFNKNRIDRCTLTAPTTVANIPAPGGVGRIVITRWILLDGYSTPYLNAGELSRTARPTGTLFGVGLTISQVTDPKAPDYGPVLSQRARAVEPAQTTRVLPLQAALVRYRQTISLNRRC